MENNDALHFYSRMVKQMVTINEHKKHKRIREQN